MGSLWSIRPVQSAVDMGSNPMLFILYIATMRASMFKAKAKAKRGSKAVSVEKGRGGNDSK